MALADHLERMPLSSYDLILALDSLIPNRCIQPGQSVEDAHRYAGTRDLVDQLMAWMEEEMDEDLAIQRSSENAQERPNGEA